MTTKKVLATVVCIMIIAGLFPSAAFAAEEVVVPEAIVISEATVQLRDGEYHVLAEGQLSSLAAYKNITFVIRDNADNTVLLYQDTSGMQGMFSVSFHLSGFSTEQRYTLSVTDEDGNTASTAIEQSFYGGDYRKLTDKTEAVKDLIAECSAIGLSDCEYEKLAVGVAEYLLPKVNENFLAGDSTLYNYQIAGLNRILDEAMENAQAYLNGTKTQRTVEPYEVGDVVAQDGVLYTQTENGKKPTFFMGHLIFESEKPDFEKLKALGINYLTLEVSLGQCSENPGTVFIVPYGFRGPWEMDGSLYQICSEDTIVASGKGAVKIASKGPQVGITADVQLKANRTYEYGAAVLADTGGLVRFGTKEIGFSASEGWQEISGTYTAGADEQKSISVVASGVTDGIYADNLYVREVGTTENLVVNGDFERGKIIRSKYGDFCFSVDSGWLETTREWAAEAADLGMACCVSLTPHYMPGHIETVSYGISNTGYNHNGFMIYNPTDEIYNELIRAMYDEAAEVFKDCKGVTQFMIANEPSFTASESPYYLSEWQAFLKERYGSLTALNTAYGTNYTDFNQIAMPAEVSLSPMYRDYREFNDSLLAETFKWQTEYLKEKAPHIETVVKTLQSNNYIKDQFKNANNYEDWAEFFEINGCDTLAFYNEEKNSLMIRGMWLDYLMSIKNAPIADLETHILRDGKLADFNDVIPGWMETVLWHGAMHNVYLTVPWLLDNGTWANFGNTMLVNRPEALKVIGEMNYDLNRLAKEIGVLQAKPAKVAMYYSRENRDDMENYILNMAETYEAVVKYGEKVDFITDSKPGKLNCGQYNLLVLTDTKVVSAEVLEEIERFISDGGKVMLVHSTDVATGDLLAFDTDGGSNDTQVVNNIRNASEVVWKPFLSDYLKTAVSEATDKNVRLVDENGKDISDCEWSYVKYGTEHLINITNHNQEKSITAYLEIDGERASDFTNLRTLADYEGSITLEPYKPVLLKTDFVGDEISVSTNGGIISASSTIPCGKLPEGATVFLGIYRNDMLIAVTKEDIDLSESEIEISLQTEASGNGIYKVCRYIFDESLLPMCGKKEKLINYKIE